MGYVIAFVQQKGSSGKTTVLSHLAHSWAHHGKSVELIDLDPKQSLAHWAVQNREVDLNFKSSKPWHAATDIRESRVAHDITLIDCPSNPGALLHTVVREADLIISPCSPSEFGIWGINIVMQTCREEGRTCRVVLNSAENHTSDDKSKTKQMLIEKGADVLESHLSHRAEFATGFLADYALPTHQVKTTAYAEIENLRIEIDTLLADT